MRSTMMAKFALSFVVAGMLVTAQGADAKPDKKKSQAALQRGKKAEAEGRGADANAAFTEAIAGDWSNAGAVRARGKDFLAAGDREKAQADFDRSVDLQPGSADGYVAR